MSQIEAPGALARHRNAPLGALLSFLWPGLGQWYGGRPRAAAIFALPPIAAVLVIVGTALSGVEQLMAMVITPSTALTIFILIVLLGIWRLIAMADAMNGIGPRDAWRRGSGAVAFTALALAVVLTHSAVGYVAWSGYENGSQIFTGESGPDTTPPPAASASAAPAADPTDDRYLATPVATPATREARINILLTGVDSADSRSTALTDTLLVASIDPTTQDVALISFPRDISWFPLYDGRTFRGKINGLMTWAENHPDEFPDGGLPTLIKELGFLLGAPIHYYAAVDLDGFRRLIDEVGGVTITNDKTINDQRYDWMDGSRGFYLPAGTHKLNGRNALAYVRSRYSAGDNDFNRSRRQQQILLALRDKLTTPEMLPHIPALLDVAGDTIRTNFPSERVGEMIELAKGVDSAATTRVVLGPPYATHPPMSTTGGVYTLKLDMDKLAELSIRIFGEDSAYADDTAG